jgi:formate dehydrogenase alpha subunit
MVTVTLNETQVTGNPGMTILDLAREHGVDIPTLCHHPALSPLGACRLCLVEVQGSRTLVASCHTPIAPNMVIATHSPKVLKARQMVLELLLASHSGFCWACDKANRCELRQIASAHGIGLPTYQLPKRYFAQEDASPYVVRDLTKCILCRRCVRACRELKGAGVLSVAYRGYATKVAVDQDQPLDKEVCADCDACISVCPVGALTKAEDRFAYAKKGPLLVVAG